VQSAPQVMPTGVEVTVPVPVPERWTSSTGLRLNVAAIAVVAVIVVVVQAPVPVQPPPAQPANDESASAVARNVTAVPLGYRSVQSVPQAMPSGVEATVPPPVPASTTLSSNCSRAKVAVTAVAAPVATAQVPDPAQAPDQPVNVEPAIGVAVKVTDMPAG
jgi:hypothetical protein